MIKLYIAIKVRLLGHDIALVREEADIHPIEGTVTVVNNPEPPANPLYTLDKFGVTVMLAFDPSQLLAVEAPASAPSAFDAPAPEVESAKD